MVRKLNIFSVSITEAKEFVFTWWKPSCEDFFFFSQIKKMNRFTDVRKCEIDLC